MKKKKSKFAEAPPVASDINEANALIEELWEQTEKQLLKLIKTTVFRWHQRAGGKKKAQSSGGRNPRRAKQGHTGRQRQLSKLKETDVVVDCLPNSTCSCSGKSEIFVHDKPFYRHQVHEIPKPTVDITEYRLFSGLQ